MAQEQATQSDQAEQAQTEEAPEAASAPRVSRSAPTPPEGRHYFWGTGRRKKAVARVRIRPGDGKFMINGRDVPQFFFSMRDQEAVVRPLRTVEMEGAWDVFANVSGGGYTGQAGAVSLGLARALAAAIPEVEPALRDRSLLTRDARMTERKKPGQPGARKRFQFSKR